MSKFLARLILSLAAVSSVPSHAAESTSPTLIGTVIVTESQIYVAAGSGSWGTSCSPVPSYVYFDRSVPNAKELLASVLAAKVGGQQVYFYGTCGTPGYFRSTYLIVL